MIVQSVYKYYKHFYFYPFFSQNKAENICDPGAQKQSEITGVYL